MSSMFPGGGGIGSGAGGQQWHQQHQQPQLTRTHANSMHTMGLLSISEVRKFVLVKCEERRVQQQKRQHYQHNLRLSWEEGKAKASGSTVGRTSSFDGLPMQAAIRDGNPPERPTRPMRPSLLIVPPEEGVYGGAMDMSTPHDAVVALNWDM